jgi:hypothetical protein
MPPRGVKSAKRERQYEHIKASEKERGVGNDRAEEIAARTVNKQRRQAGETKNSKAGTASARKTSAAKRTSKTATAKRTRKTATAKRTKKTASKKR